MPDTSHFERSHSILIAASPSAVLDYVSNPNTWPEWITTHRLESPDRPLVKGDTFREYWATRKGDATLDWTVIDSAPASFWLGETFASFIGTIQVRYDVENVDGQTKFTRTMINPTRPKPPTDEMVARMDAEAAECLKKIKANLEAG